MAIVEVPFWRQELSASKNMAKYQLRRPVDLQAHVTCPYGKPGDFVVATEPFRIVAVRRIGAELWATVWRGADVTYHRSWAFYNLLRDTALQEWEHTGRYAFEASRMPVMLGRYWFRVLDTAVQYLGSITDAECIAEGVQPDAVGSARNQYMAWWDQNTEHTWRNNPPVWVVSLLPLSDHQRMYQRQLDNYVLSDFSPRGV